MKLKFNDAKYTPEIITNSENTNWSIPYLYFIQKYSLLKHIFMSELGLDKNSEGLYNTLCTRKIRYGLKCFKVLD